MRFNTMSDKTVYWLVFAILSFPLVLNGLSLIIEPERIFAPPHYVLIMLGLFSSLCTWLFIVYLFGEEHGIKKGVLFFVVTAIPGFGSIACWLYWLATLKWKFI